MNIDCILSIIDVHSLPDRNTGVTNSGERTDGSMDLWIYCYLIGTQALQTAAQHGAGHPVNDNKQAIKIKIKNAEPHQENKMLEKS